MRWNGPAAMTVVLLLALPGAEVVAAAELATVKVGEEPCMMERMLDGTVEAVHQAPLHDVLHGLRRGDVSVSSLFTDDRWA